MERQMKERLVGVGVIVVLMIVFVPMILDGPESTKTRSKPVDLPRQNPGEWKEKTFSLDSEVAGNSDKADGSTPSENASSRAGRLPDTPDASDESEAAEDTTTVTRDDGGRSTPDKPASSPDPNGSVQAPVESDPQPDAQPDTRQSSVATDTPPEAGKGWAVQVGSFSRRENADGLASTLRESGYEVYVTPFRQKGRKLYRVRVGPVASRAEAEALAARVRDDTGGPAKPVPAG